ncbi:hypothetical protein HY469_04125 [Candidatus Roizmanbacteria bacterium]|nr:hypothetical protein [Candidatus Roizmanbacteria bacterium]
MKEIKLMCRGFAPIIIVSIIAAFLIGIGATVGYLKLKPKYTAPSTQKTAIETTQSPESSTQQSPDPTAD